MKHEPDWRKFKCLDLDCAIHLSKNVFYCGGKSVDLNDLHADLARLMPKANAKPHHWTPFLQAAIAKGFL